MVATESQQNQQYGFNSVMLFLDRGLQSPALADVLAVVRGCPCYVEEMPFPVLVNAVLLRLAETFQGEKFNPKLEQFLNLVRLNIIKAVREFRHHLQVAFSSEDIVRYIMKVSHSNDFYARSLTLLFLSALAPLVAENAKAHHLIIESLDCSEETELSAAIVAATEFGHHSVTFCALMIGKIGQVLSCNQTATEVKMRLLNVMGNFRKNVRITRTCFRLSEQLLTSSFSRLLHVTALDAATQLAARSELADEQISVLLPELKKVVEQRNVQLIVCALRNLSRLAEFPRQWSTEQVQKLSDMFEQLNAINSRRIVCAWLKTVEVLTALDFHCHLFIGHDTLWTRLLKSDDIGLRVAGLRLLLNVMRNSEDQDHLREIFLETVAQTVVDFRRNAAVSGGTTIEMQQFYKSVSTFARMPQCTSVNALSIVNDLIAECSTTSDDDGNDAPKTSCVLLGLVAETLCSISDAHSRECATVTASWALRQFIALSTCDDQLDFNKKMDADVVKHLRLLTSPPAKETATIPLALYNLILMPSTLPQPPMRRGQIATQSSSSMSVIILDEEHEELIIEDSDQMDIDTDRTGVSLTKKRLRGPFSEFLLSFNEILASAHRADSRLETSHGWMLYKIARCAFHYGHWNDVTLPLLERLEKSCDSMETSSWINALINIANIQWSNAEELSVSELNISYHHLRNAYLIFQRLAATPRHGEHCFAFAAAYTNCLAMSWQAVKLLFSAVNFHLLALQQHRPFVSTDKDLLPHSCVEQIYEAISSAGERILSAHAEWIVLLSRSFDADAHTLEHIHLWSQFTLILANALLFLCAEPMKDLHLANENHNFGGNRRVVSNDTSISESRVRRNAINSRFFEVIVDAKRTLDELVGEQPREGDGSGEPSTKSEQPDDAAAFRKEVLQKRATSQNISIVKEMLSFLKRIPLSLPRYFFQRIFHTQIKLNVSPQPCDSDGAIAIHVSLLPLMVEGVVQSDNAKGINTVTVTAEFICAADNSKSFFEKREICLEAGENYFKTQFLLKITEPSTKVFVRVQFTDLVTRRQWVDELASAELLVNYSETAKRTSSVSVATAATSTVILT